MSQRIKVLIRPKPLTKDQIKTTVHIDYPNNVITISKPNLKMQNLLPKINTVRAFAFAKILTPGISQEQVYQQCAFSLVQNVLSGYNGTIFAYGQTGSGKTYTIMGGKQYMQRKAVIKKEEGQPLKQNHKESEVKNYINELKGIIPRSFNQIITVTKSQKNKKHLITCSFIEIYNQNVHDLLGEDTKVNLSIKQNANKGLVIEGLKTSIVKSVQQLQTFFKIGYRNRSVRQTSMNQQSSRSHCIFTIKIQQQSTDEMGNTKFKVGKLNLVDLAGSQRQSKTHANEDGIKQATKINLSLSALGKVINCLSNYKEKQKNYIPYRDSKLTRILQDSLGGNTKTVMIATISTNSSNYEQSLSTLIYAGRAKFIQNNPVMNEDPKDVLLRQYMQEIQKLKILLMEKELQNQGLKETFVNQTMRPAETLGEKSVIEKLDKQQEYIKKKIEDLQNIVKKQNLQNEEQKKQLQKIELLKKKIKLQEQRQIQLQRLTKIRQQQLLLIQKDYKTLNEEVDMLRNKFKELKNKYTLKCQQLQDLGKQYNDDKVQYHFIIKQKDKQIKKLEKLLATVLEEQTYKQVVDENDESGYSQNQSNYSTKKMFNNIKVQNKAKVKFNDVNLYKQATQRGSKYQKQQKGKKQQYHLNGLPKIQKLSRKQSTLQGRNYQSQQQKKIKKVEQRSSYTSLKTIDKQKQKRERIKKVDSMISLKPRGSVKLPFMSQIKKMNSPKQYQITPQKKSQYSSKITLDIQRIKDEILSELKLSKNKYL